MTGLAGGLAAAQAPPPAPPAWRWRIGAALGFVPGPGEIGREELIARVGAGIGMGFQAGIESRIGGIELRTLGFSSAVEVEDQGGAEFPNHGRRPFVWTAGVTAYPLAPVFRAGTGPFVAGGLGGILLSADLDNVEGQTWYHSFLWSLGGGARVAMGPEEPSWAPAFLELRVERMRVWSNGPLRSFTVWVGAVGIALRN